jgi:Pre-toxin TG
MAGGITPYQNALPAAGVRLDALLRSGVGSASMLAAARRSHEIMTTELKSPGSVLVYDNLPADKNGFKGADRWRLECEKKANAEINPQFLPSNDWLKKAQDYTNLGLRIVSDKHVRQQVIVDKQRGKLYIIFGELPIVAEVMKMISSELTAWFRAQPNSKAIMSMSPEAGLATMLSERPDLVILCRLAQNTPLDSETRNVPVDRPAAVEASELAIGLVPFVGNTVAAYEAYAGVNLFGYHLTDIERGILGVAVLLPIAGRLVKAGHLLYTEARLVSLYGRDAAA